MFRLVCFIGCYLVVFLAGCSTPTKLQERAVEIQTIGSRSLASETKHRKKNIRSHFIRTKESDVDDEKSGNEDRDEIARKAHALSFLRRHSNGRKKGFDSRNQLRAYERAVQFQNRSSNGQIHPHDIPLQFPNSLTSLKWQSLGPNGATNDYGNSIGAGRVESILYQESSKRIFLGTVAGGIWRGVWTGSSFDPNTISYRAVSDHQSTLSIGALAADPNQPDTLYAATGESSDFDFTYHSGGVLKSIDGGLTWIRVDTWAPLTPNLFNGKKMSQIWVDPNDSNHLLVSVLKAGLFESNDAGKTWVLKIQATSYVYFSYSNDGKSLLFSSSGAEQKTGIGLYFSLDSGKTFQRSQLNLKGATPSTAIAKTSYSPLNSSIIWLSVAPYDDGATKMSSVTGLYRSEDAGATFVQEISFQNSNYTEDNFGLNGYSMGIAASPTDPNKVFLAGMNAWSYIHGDPQMLQKTSWDLSKDQLPALHPDTHFFSPVAGKLFIGNDGGAYVSVDEGVSWQGVNQGVSTFQIYSVCLGGQSGFETIFAGMQDAGLAKPDAQKKAWKIVNNGDGIDCKYDPNDNQFLYAANYNGTYYVSGTSGDDLTELPVLPLDEDQGEKSSFFAPINIDANDSTKIYGVGGRVYESAVDPKLVLTGDFDLNDPNASMNFWKPLGGQIFPGNTDGILQLKKVGTKDKPTFYAVTYYDIARGDVKIQDGVISNINWTSIKPPGDFVFTGIEVHPNDPNLIVATAGGYKQSQIWKSVDGGVNWKNIVSNYAKINSPVNGALIHFSQSRPNSQDLYIASDHGIYFADISIDSPQWINVGTGIPNTIINQILMTPDQKYLAAVTFGRGIWTLALPPEAR